MATRTVLVDDMDGGNADVTIAFVVDGKSYSLDLSHDNAAKFRNLLAPYMAAATKTAHTKSSSLKTQIAGVEQRAAIRDWARRQGVTISDRGRIPQDVIEEYNKFHNGKS